MKKLSLTLSRLIIIILLSISYSYSSENIIKGDAPESYYRGKKQTCIEDSKNVFCGQISKEKLIEKIGNNFLICNIEINKDKYK